MTVATLVLDLLGGGFLYLLFAWLHEQFFEHEPDGVSANGHRGTNPQVHGDTDQASSAGDDGASTVVASGGTGSAGPPWPHSGQGAGIVTVTIFGGGGHGGSRSAGPGRAGGAHGGPGIFRASGGPGVACPEWPKLPSEGIRAGEIVAWRAWKIKGDALYSITARTGWLPGVPMQGDVDRYGVYALKRMEDVESLVLGRGCFYAIGSVEMWGEIVEHSNGYRAQFAAIRSLESCRPSRVGWPQATIEDLRSRYLPSAPKVEG